MHKPLLLFLAITALITSCGTSKWGEPTAIEIRYDKNAEINYGHSFIVKTYLKYSEGQEKDISGKSGLEYKVSGATISGRRVKLHSYPLSFQDDEVHVEAIYIKKELNFSDKKTIPFNYRGDLELSFNGAQGEAGETGSDGGSSIIFRDGKNGDYGIAGDDGRNGHDLTAHIYKNETTQIYYIRITDLNTSQIYYFKNKDVGFPIKFFVSGGRGGSGGAGGDGGDGKDGKKTEKKTKRPGDGGNGGDGGFAGNGGNGGTVYVFIHPSAADIQKRIIGYSWGGPGGEGGAGGKAGKAGTPLENQDPQSEGIAGGHGSPGQKGIAGAGIQFSLEDFDIDF